MVAPVHPLQLVIGPAVWALWFVGLYGGLSVGCVLAPPPPGQGAATWLNGALLVFTVLVVVLLIYLAARCWRAATAARDGTARFYGGTAALTYLLSAASVLAIGLPSLVLPPCV